MQSEPIPYNPFIRKHDSTSKVMQDVIIALLPCIVMAMFVFGFYPFWVISAAVVSCVATEIIFSAIFFKNIRSVMDGSAVVTGILLAFTLGAFTPLYVVAFGGMTAILFGKMLWGGLGRNRFNPALTGREFMTVFFPAIMSSNLIWYNSSKVLIEELHITGDSFINHLFLRVSGAFGEYSVILLMLGGIYLLLRRRISWHIPAALLSMFAILVFIFAGTGIRFSIGGLFLGAIFMATDMPTSSSTPAGKIYLGMMIAVVNILCILNDVKDGYSSYAILLLNGFVHPINWTFRPRVWGMKRDLFNRIWQTLLLTLVIIALAYGIIFLHHADGIQYIIYAFAVYCIVRFIYKGRKKDLIQNINDDL